MRPQQCLVLSRFQFQALSSMVRPSTLRLAFLLASAFGPPCAPRPQHGHLRLLTGSCPKHWRHFAGSDLPGLDQMTPVLAYRRDENKMSIRWQRRQLKRFHQDNTLCVPGKHVPVQIIKRCGVVVTYLLLTFEPKPVAELELPPEVLDWAPCGCFKAEPPS